MNLIIWFVMALTTAKLAYKLSYPSRRLQFFQIFLICEAGAFTVGSTSHLLLGLGNIYRFSLISLQLSWSGSFLALLLVSFYPQLLKARWILDIQLFMQRIVSLVSKLNSYSKYIGA